MNTKLLAIVLLAVAGARADSVYRLEFRIQQESDQTSRELRYSMRLAGGSRGKIIAGLRVPYFMKEREVHTVIGRGTVIDCRIADEADQRLRLDCGFEVNEVPPDQPRPAAGLLPQIHAHSITTTMVAGLGKEYQLAALDDPVSGTTLQIFVTARLGSE